MLFQSRIKEAIKESDLSQKQLAKILNIAESNITNWKKGDNLPSIEMLYNLCKILDVTSDYLLGLDEDNKQNNSVNINNVHNSFNGNNKF